MSMIKVTDLTFSYDTSDDYIFENVSFQIDTNWKLGFIGRKYFKTVLRKLGFERIQFEKRLHELSEGQKKKVLLAKSLAGKAHLYIWDEPLNYIDLFSRQQIEDLILEYQPTMLFVEHDRAFGDKIKTKEVEVRSS